MSVGLWIIVCIAVFFMGAGLGYVIRKRQAEAKIGSAEAKALQLIETAQRDIEAKKKETLLEAKEEAHRIRQEAEREGRERRIEIQKLEKRILLKEESLDKKLETLDQRTDLLRDREQNFTKRETEIDALYAQQHKELERVAGLSQDQARQLVMAEVEREARHDAAVLMKEIEQQAKAEAEKKAKDIIATAVQRCAADHAAEITVSVVNLPNDEMKGRIIGREGRNIRALETLTGIDLIIDDTPEAVILSGFDPIRREIARVALERLVADGRIHPARIEEMVEKSRRDLEELIREEGEQAVFETGLHSVHPDFVKLLGRLKFRTSYGQNVLKHSIEVAQLAGLMAAELGLDVNQARRGGLLHDIGKAVTHEVEGSHVEIGVDLARRYKEHPVIVNAIAAHHGDVEFTSPISVLVAAADAISAARPGARRETLDIYMKRLEKLESIAESFEGVDKCFAIQAGREIRIMVRPDVVDDASSVRMAKEISKKIQSELDYPGQIKVTVIRETRAVEYAK
ncbi:ribonuclease Y [Alicyclobacillaceae bacterium I2511]|nr:ribonuclease Y [Alicyclobacillaceae bacterium I2511]